MESQGTIARVVMAPMNSDAAKSMHNSCNDRMHPCNDAQNETDYVTSIPRWMAAKTPKG